MDVNTTRRGDVHQAGVVADGLRRQREQVDRIGERGTAAQIDGPAATGNHLAGGAVFLRPQYPNPVARRIESLCKLGEILKRPALGGAVFGTRHEGHDRP